MFASANPPSLPRSGMVAVEISKPALILSATMRMSAEGFARSGGMKLIGKQHIADKVPAFEQEARRHPTPSLRPHRHSCGRKQPLSKHAGCDVEIRNTRNLREAQFLES